MGPTGTGPVDLKAHRQAGQACITFWTRPPTSFSWISCRTAASVRASKGITEIALGGLKGSITQREGLEHDGKGRGDGKERPSMGAGADETTALGERDRGWGKVMCRSLQDT